MVSVADVSAEALEKEKAIEMEKEDIKSKPEAIRCVGVGWMGQRFRGRSTADILMDVFAHNKLVDAS